MKFKKLFSLSALCLVGVMGVGLLASCDETEDEAEEDETTTTDDGGSTPSPSSISIDEGLYTFSGNLTFELTDEATGSLASGGTYSGSVDIPLTVTINVGNNDHFTVLVDSDIPSATAPTEVLDIKLTGYGGDVLDSVESSHVTSYYDSEEGNIYYYRVDSGTGTDIDTYEVWGNFTSDEFMKNPLLYITRDMFGAGARIFDGIDGKVSEETLDMDAVTSSISESAVTSAITDASGENVGQKIESGFDGGATYTNDALLGDVSLSASIYDNHSLDSIYVYLPTCFAFSYGVSVFTYNFNCDFTMTLDLTIDSYSNAASTAPFSEFQTYISENSEHFVTNTVTALSSLVNVEDTGEEGETVTVTPKTYTDVTTYTGYITLSLTNISVYTGEGDEITYTYSGSAPIETTLDVGTYTDGDGETQYTYVLDCEIPIVTVTFNSGLARTIKLTGYGNNILSSSVTTSHLTAYYDTGDDMIMWHRIDTGSDSAITARQTIDTYENWGAFEQEEFAKNPYYYITHDFFGCGQRIYQEAVEAIDEESIVGSDIVGSSQEGTINAQLSSTFEWDSVNLKFEIDVSLTTDTTDSQSKAESELISEFVSYINENDAHFIKNTIVEDSYMSTSSEDGD